MSAPSPPPHHPPKTGAFTIVEMLVVISIIGLLLAIIMPSLSAAQRSARKTSEMNSLREVMKAWLLYANHNNDAALPGYMEVPVQAPNDPAIPHRGWGVKYKYQDGVYIPPAANLNADPQFNIAGPWTWRLMPYLDYAHDIVLGYATHVGDVEVEWIMRGHDPSSPLYEISARPEDALHVALEPAFGYNGYYIGGYWRIPPDAQDPDDPNCPTPSPATPAFKFYRHREVTGSAGGSPVTVATKVSQIRRSSQIVTFCASTKVQANQGSVIKRFPDGTLGSFWVTPPLVGETQQWAIGEMGLEIAGPAPIEDNDSVYLPLARHGDSAALFFADGHLDRSAPSGLEDQRMWIDGANDRWYKHRWFPCSPPSPGN